MSEVLTYLCPFCESAVRVGSPCPGCAKKPKKPIPALKSIDALDLPDDDFDYDDFIEREFSQLPHRRLRLRWYWWVIAVLFILGMILEIFWPH